MPTARAPCGVFSTTVTCEEPRSSTATRRVADCSDPVTGGVSQPELDLLIFARRGIDNEDEATSVTPILLAVRWLSDLRVDAESSRRRPHVEGCWWSARRR